MTGAIAIPSPSKAIRRRIATLYVVFFLSGFSALIYQTAWQRVLGLFAGSDMVATTIVVGAFLFGLGVGSLWSASFADRLSHRRALVAFALCELGVGTFALASRLLFFDVVVGQLVVFAHSQTLITLIVFVALLPPTILMGMSLPLLSRAVVHRIETASSEIGWLYGVNTFGASFGALLSGFFFIGAFGYEITIYFAALLNFMVFAGALIVASHFGDEAPAERPSNVRFVTSGVPFRIWFWCAIVFVSGFLIISLEIIWFRVLGVLMQSNAYAFPLILSCVLVGDAAGIVYGARVARNTANPLALFQGLQGLMALYALLSLGLLYVALGSFGLSHWLTDGKFATADWWPRLAYLTLYAAITAVCVFPPAFLLGMSFPITQEAVQDDRDMVAHRVGLVQLFNIFGNTFGAIVTGLALLHWLGASGTIRLIGIAGLVFLAALIWNVRRSPEHIRWSVCAAVLALAVLAFPESSRFWSQLHGATSSGKTVVGEDRTGVVVLRPEAKSEVHYGDDVGSDAELLYVSGHAQSRIPFLTVHGALGVVGPLIHPKPKSMLLIGYGSGATPYAAGVNPETETIRVIELIQPVYSVMDIFSATSANSAIRRLRDDGRIERILGDGRHFLYTDNSHYDVIQADAIYPWSSHAGLLYSVEFFREVKAHLRDGGVFVQWAPTERTLATFLAVFPYVLQLNDVVVGSNQPIPYARSTFADRLHSRATHSYLEAAQWKPDHILDRLLEQPEQMWTPNDKRTDADVNTDLFPKDEYFLSRRKFSPVRHLPKNANP